MRCLWLSVFIMSGCPAGLAQPGITPADSLPLRILEPVVVQSFAMEGDRLQSFYRTTQSATTEDILCHLSSLYLIRRGAYGQEPMIRGLSAAQLTLSIDGMRMFGACTDKMDPVSIYIEPQNLEQVSVTPGTFGSAAGASVGGTVNLQLAQPDFGNPLQLKAGTSYFSASQGVAAYTIVKAHRKNNAVRLSSVYRKHQNYTDGNGEKIPYTQYEKFNLMLSGTHLLNPTDTLRADVLADYGWNIGFPALPMDVGYASNATLGITYSRARDRRWFPFLRAKVYASRIYHLMDDTQRPDLVMHMDMPGTSTTVGWFTEGEVRKLKNHRLTFRADGYANFALAEMTMYPENEAPMYMQTWPQMWRSVSGIFINDSYRVNPRTQVSANFRLDWAGTNINEGFGIDQLRVFYPELDNFRIQVPFSLNLMVERYLNRDLQLVVQAGYGQRIPSISEHAGFYLFNRMDGYDYIGNPYLKTEKSLSGNLSLNYLGQFMEAQLTAYHQYFTDYIFAQTEEALSPMTPGAYGVRVYQNIPGAYFNGFETQLSWQLFRTVHLFDQIKCVHARTTDRQPLPLIPPLTHQLSVRYTLKNFSIQTDVDQNLAQKRINPGFGEDQTPAFTVLHLRLSYQIKKWLLQGGIENLLDKKYHTHLDWGNIPRPGRNIYLTLELKL